MRHTQWFLLSCLVGCTASLNDASPSPNGAGGAGAGSATGGSSGTGTGGGGAEPPVVLPGGVTLEGKPNYYRVVRLTHQQWENAARDVLQLPQTPGLSSGFSPDPPNGKFTNNEKALYLTNSLWTDYQRAAETLAEQVTKDAAALARLGSAADSAGFVRKLGHAAYHRPLHADEEQRYNQLYAAGPSFFESGNAFADGARVVIEAMLQSPNFLHRVELSEKGQRLSGTELAAKLSFLLRDSVPDATLLGTAEQGALADDTQLAKVATDLLATNPARDVVQRFHSELFGLSRFGSIAKDVARFPSYKDSLNASLVEADRQFFDRIFQGGQGFRDILTSRLAFVNAESAPYYGVTATGTALSEVMLDESRPGFLTRLGFLAYNATLQDPDPIHRGVDITRRILCMSLSPPAGTIPPLPPFVPGQTNRERVAAHTGQGICAGCHNTYINPLGFAFEGFDALGQARTMDNGKPVDTTGKYNIGGVEKAYSGAAELSAMLADSEQAHGCYSANLAEFVLARDVANGDGTLVAGVQSASLTQRRSLKDSVLALVTSKEFTTALGGAP